MEETIRFSSKPMRAFRIVTFSLCCILFAVLMVFAFNVYALIAGTLMLLLIAFVIWFLNRRSIRIQGKEIVVIGLRAHHIPIEKITGIQCLSDHGGIIEIQTKSATIRTSGYLLLKGTKEEKNRELVQKLSKRYRK